MSKPAISGLRGCCPRQLARLFWERVDRGDPTECWEWSGYRNHDGYGRILIRNDQGGFHWRSNRLSYVVHHGSIPDGSIVLHSCHNPPCVNPAHLRAGSYSENEFDKVRSGSHHEANKTHCKRGHEFNDINSFSRRGRRVCRICRRIRASKKYKDTVIK